MHHPPYLNLSPYEWYQSIPILPTNISSTHINYTYRLTLVHISSSKLIGSEVWENEKFNRGRWKIFILEQIIANHLIWLKMKREDEIKWFEREWNEFSKFHFSKSHTFYSVELKGRWMKIFNFLPINLTEYEVWKNEKFSTLSKWLRRYRNKLITLNKVVW